MIFPQFSAAARRGRWFLTGVLALTLAACGGSDDSPVAADVPAVATTTLSASMSGDQEPTPTLTGALGTGTVTVVDESGALTGSITVEGVAATVAHIHQGEVGTNGPIIVNLAQTAPGSNVWAVPAGTVLTAAQRTALNAGGLYFNAHSAENPGGEIRGQIGRQVSAAQLSAAQEVPTNSTTATGVGFLSLDPVTRRIVARLTLTGMTATAAHIHTGAVGVNGPIIVNLTQTAAGSGIWVSAADATLTDAQIALINSGELYFNAHSAAFPGGQIRGQIGRNVSYASLNAGQEIPTNSSGATGTGIVVFDAANRAISGGITLTGITATAAHIHTGAVGINGPIIVNLVNAGGGVWNVPAATRFTADQFKAFKQGNLYFNAHSAAFPGGEIRGQIGRTAAVVHMSAAQEIPTNASTATGSALVSVDPSTRQVTARITLTGMTATAAHIHEAAVGANGPILINLSETAQGSGIWVSAANAALTEAQLATFAAGGMYFNAHSTAFPGGEIRGQINQTVNTATLTAFQEVPTNASTARGSALLTVDPTTRQLIARAAITGMAMTAAHIHQAPAGANGPIVVNLSETAPGSNVWVSAANAGLTDAQFAAYLAGGLYFNAHSAAFPGGEIRAQIDPNDSDEGHGH